MSGMILLGPPGAGKGTVAAYVQRKRDVPVVSTGHLLRQAIAAGTPLGLAAKTLMDQGHLVSDDVVIGLVKDFLAQPVCQHGALFDGFPRTVGQAEAILTERIGIRLVCCLTVADDVIVARMSGRRVHPASGRVYHIDNAPPQQAGLDDETGEPLETRPDDQPEVVLDRLRVYHAQTKPLIAFYRARAVVDQSLVFVEVDASQAVAQVQAEVLRHVDVAMHAV